MSKVLLLNALGNTSGTGGDGWELGWCWVVKAWWRYYTLLQNGVTNRPGSDTRKPSVAYKDFPRSIPTHTNCRTTPQTHWHEWWEIETLSYRNVRSMPPRMTSTTHIRWVSICVYLPLAIGWIGRRFTRAITPPCPCLTLQEWLVVWQQEFR
jgi:hypothetical protein